MSEFEGFACAENFLSKKNILAELTEKAVHKTYSILEKTRRQKAPIPWDAWAGERSIKMNSEVK